MTAIKLRKRLPWNRYLVPWQPFGIHLVKTFNESANLQSKCNDLFSLIIRLFDERTYFNKLSRLKVYE